MTLTFQATQKLRQDILSGAINSNDELTERALCERLGMSRSPVRTALQILAGEGLLTYSEKRGYRLRKITPSLISNAYEVRAVLEGLACRLLSESRPTSQLLAELHEELDKGGAILSRYDDYFDTAAWSEMNERFHNIILDGAGNPSLIQALKQATGAPLASFTFTTVFRKQAEWALLQIAHDMHCRIVQALECGESQRVDALMREHIFIARDLILEELRNSSAGMS